MPNVISSFRTRTIFFIWFALAFVSAYFGVLWLESENRADSIGIWYTIYSAIVIGAIFAGLIALIHKLLTRGR